MRNKFKQCGNPAIKIGVGHDEREGRLTRPGVGVGDTVGRLESATVMSLTSLSCSGHRRCTHRHSQACARKRVNVASEGRTSGNCLLVDIWNRGESSQG